MISNLEVRINITFRPVQFWTVHENMRKWSKEKRLFDITGITCVSTINLIEEIDTDAQRSTWCDHSNEFIMPHPSGIWWWWEFRKPFERKFALGRSLMMCHFAYFPWSNFEEHNRWRPPITPINSSHITSSSLTSESCFNSIKPNRMLRL